jgi:hypothetical protein
MTAELDAAFERLVTFPSDEFFPQKPISPMRRQVAFVIVVGVCVRLRRMFLDPEVAICGIEPGRNNDIALAEFIMFKPTSIHD